MDIPKQYTTKYVSFYRLVHVFNSSLLMDRYSAVNNSPFKS